MRGLRVAEQLGDRQQVDALRGQVLQQLRVVAYFPGCSFEHQSAAIEYIRVVGDAQGEIEVLLHQNDAYLLRELLL